MTYCCIDLGNTSAKVGIFDPEGRSLSHLRRERLQPNDIRQLKQDYAFDHVILSSTRHVRPELRDYLSRTFHFIELDHHTPIPINNAYQTPETLGRDRLAASIGAWAKDKGGTHLVIDAGTCITYDVVHDGTYQGGNIAPGLRMRLVAMHNQTDKLPLVELLDSGYHLGRSTTSALQNGALLGTICEIESFIRRTGLIYGDLSTTLTGGDADYLADRLECDIFVASNLVLEGLFTILHYNAQ